MRLILDSHLWLLLPNLSLIWMPIARADCNAYSPAFPLPQLQPNSEDIQQARVDIESILKRAISAPQQNTTSFSIAVTSSKETLFELHHTARDRDENRPGADVINGNSCYRIASCTKAFTVLALLQQQKAGKLNLDDPINKYISDLNTPQEGTLPWKDITLRTLATQLSGIPRDIGQAELLTDLQDPVSHGLPPLSPSKHHEAQCDSVTNFTKPCTQTDLLNYVKKALPIFPPKQQSTYSNLNFELLAIALENITSTPYETLVHTEILRTLNMTSTTFSRPSDSVAALPKGNFYYWDVVMGMQNPTGGLYSSTTDLTKFIRYILTSYNGLTPALNWIHPVSFGASLNSFYGMPWEIYRTTQILDYTNRPITFVTKSGGLPGYSSIIASIPEYDFGVVVLVAGDNDAASIMFKTALKAIAPRMVMAADKIAQETLAAKYTGTWSAPEHLNLNSSITFSHSLTRGGLYVEKWISNGTDILGELGTIGLAGTKESAAQNQYLQGVPTLLFKDEKNQKGEIWRLIGHPIEAEDGGSVLSDFCLTDIDVGAYGGLPINEVVFWDEVEGEGFGGVELTAFRVKLEREGEERLVVQA